jgi:outer membrane protein OmpA-like peptidoglycan-associated protein
MTGRVVRFLSASGISVGIALLVASCSLLSRQSSEPGPSKRMQRGAPAKHIAQLDFGHGASFAVCTEPACPSLTPKTLARAIDPPTASQTVPAPTTATASPVMPHPATSPSAADPAFAKTTPTHHVVVHFTPASALLSPSAEATLARSLHYALKANRIVIFGRTDSLGADGSNQSLALARALSVRDYLREREPSIQADMVLDVKGSCCFIASNDTPQGRRQNRRVEIVFSAPGQVAP